MKGLVAAHSGMRYIVLLLLLIAIVNAAMNLKSDKYGNKDKKINLFAMIFLHIQLLLGIALAFMSTKFQFAKGMMGNEVLRFFTVEHTLLMLAAIVLITLGRSRAEKLEDPAKKHQMFFRYYGLGLVIIFIAIPWPFIHSVGAGYF